MAYQTDDKYNGRVSQIRKEALRLTGFLKNLGKSANVIIKLQGNFRLQQTYLVGSKHYGATVETTFAISDELYPHPHPSITPPPVDSQSQKPNKLQAALTAANGY